MLSPKEIEEGWILLFDGETTFGWKTEGEVKVEDGQLRLGGTKKSAIETTTVFGACNVEFTYNLLGKGKVTVASINDNFPDTNNFLGCWLTSIINVSKEHGATGAIKKVDSEIQTAWARKKTGKAVSPSPVRFEVEEGSTLVLKSIKLRPDEIQPLFNAKDLAGWKVFDEAKKNQSKWSVTKEGWLNVKNGPGDLQSEGKYDDFVLQLECISNGKALNSGIFFRCIESQYQNGYEMQIQNGFKDNDRTKPADFGTGAIYRRIAARKVVPNDNEWFAMTLVANGNHISTWVNGYQTVDWTDDRPADPNPRKGSKTGAGHLSIQGHDPTTDLSFRNLRIAELKSEKK